MVHISESALRFAYDRYIRREATLDAIAAELGCLQRVLTKRFQRRGWPNLSKVMGWKDRSIYARNVAPFTPGEHPYIPVEWGGACVVCDRVMCGK